MLCTYRPETGHCLCWRDGCLMSLLGCKDKEEEKEEVEPACQSCPYKPPTKGGGGRKAKRKMYEVAGNEVRGGSSPGATQLAAGPPPLLIYFAHFAVFLFSDVFSSFEHQRDPT